MIPNWPKANQLPICKSSRRFELRTTENKLSASDVGGTLTRGSDYRDVQCSIRSATLNHSILYIFKGNDCTYQHIYLLPALPDGWFQFGTKVYKKFSEKSTWKQAKQICQANGGNLVTIQSESENKFIFEMFVQNKTNTTQGKLEIV